MLRNATPVRLRATATCFAMATALVIAGLGEVAAGEDGSGGIPAAAPDLPRQGLARRTWTVLRHRLSRHRRPQDDAAVRRAAKTEDAAQPPPTQPTTTPPPETTAPPPTPRIEPEAVPLLVNVTTPEAQQRAAEATFLVRALGLQDSPTKVYGWIQNSYTGNTNGKGNGSNFSVFPNRLADAWQGNQYYLILENALEASDQINFGFRYDVLFGNDWEFTKDYGLFDRAFTPNHFAGVDFPQIYGEVHLPVLTPWGLDVRGGRFYSPAGFEGVQATKRPLLSVPYTLNFTPFTFFGMIGTLHLLENNRVNLYAGAVNGWDRWIDASYKWSMLGGYSLTSRSGTTSLNTFFVIGPDQLPRFPPANTPFFPTGTTPPPFLAGRRNLGYGNPRTYFSTVLTHNWSDRFTEALQADQVLDKNSPGFGPGGSPHDTAWYSLVHWFLYGFDAPLSDAKVTGSWRIEAFRDNNGAATSVAADYFETSLGLILKPKSWIWIRPEARYDWVRGSAHPFSNDTRSSQLILDFDVIILF
jgi:hypothetical protein